MGIRAYVQIRQPVYVCSGLSTWAQPMAARYLEEACGVPIFTDADAPESAVEWTIELTDDVVARLKRAVDDLSKREDALDEYTSDESLRSCGHAGSLARTIKIGLDAAAENGDSCILVRWM